MAAEAGHSALASKLVPPPPSPPPRHSPPPSSPPPTPPPTPPRSSVAAAAWRCWPKLLSLRSRNTYACTSTPASAREDTYSAVVSCVRLPRTHAVLRVHGSHTTAPPTSPHISPHLGLVDEVLDRVLRDVRRSPPYLPISPPISRRHAGCLPSLGSSPPRPPRTPRRSPAPPTSATTGACLRSSLARSGARAFLFFTATQASPTPLSLQPRSPTPPSLQPRSPRPITTTHRPLPRVRRECGCCTAGVNGASSHLLP